MQSSKALSDNNNTCPHHPLPSHNGNYIQVEMGHQLGEEVENNIMWKCAKVATGITKYILPCQVLLIVGDMLR